MAYGECHFAACLSDRVLADALRSGSVSKSGHDQGVQSAEEAVPWYHYIPLKPDYSDLYDIMAFFAGPIDELGNINESLGHDVSSHSP